MVIIDRKSGFSYCIQKNPLLFLFYIYAYFNAYFQNIRTLYTLFHSYAFIHRNMYQCTFLLMNSGCTLEYMIFCSEYRP